MQIKTFSNSDGCFAQSSDIFKQCRHFNVGHSSLLLQLDGQGGHAAEHGESLDLSDKLLPREHDDCLAHVDHGVVEGVIVFWMDHLHNVRPHLHAGSHQDKIDAVQDKAAKIALV